MPNEPIVPKTTHGKVLPRINSRILVKTSSPPPRKIIGPVNAIPPPVAPLHPIRQQDKGVVVMTNPPRALISQFIV
jgi:hypothetical protein